jgi:hypothetical protein
MTDAANTAAANAPVEPTREKIVEMLRLSRGRRLPRLILALDKLRSKIGSGVSVDAAGLVALEKMVEEEGAKFEASPPWDLDKLTDRQLRQLAVIKRVATGGAPSLERVPEPERTQRWWWAEDLCARLDEIEARGAITLEEKPVIVSRLRALLPSFVGCIAAFTFPYRANPDLGKPAPAPERGADGKNAAEPVSTIAEITSRRRDAVRTIR